MLKLSPFKFGISNLKGLNTSLESGNGLKALNNKFRTISRVFSVSFVGNYSEFCKYPDYLIGPEIKHSNIFRQFLSFSDSPKRLREIGTWEM